MGFCRGFQVQDGPSIPFNHVLPLTLAFTSVQDQILCCFLGLGFEVQALASDIPAAETSYLKTYGRTP